MSSDLSILAEALRDVPAEKLPHGLGQYARFGPKTVRAILAVRDLVFHTPELEETRFRIGLTGDPGREREADCVRFEVVFESDDWEEARTVEADTRLNFLWHFPGRCLNKGDYRQVEVADGARCFVYVACFPAEALPILGKA
jgi:hypothetical protein